MAVSMVEVANIAGVSRGTVSDVVRDTWRAKGITEPTYKKVKLALEKLNYRPNHLARSLVSGKTRTIGVQLPSFSNKYWEAIIQHLDISARRENYHLFLSAPAEWQDEGEEIKRLCEHRVDGLILGLRLGRRLWRLFKEFYVGRIPFCFIGNSPVDNYYAVIDDDFSQAKLAVEHLISLGHTRVAYVHGESSNPGLVRRRRGYLQTMAQYGFEVPKEYIQNAYFNEEHARKAMIQLLALNHPPTAVYCASDTMAVGAIRAIEDFGLRVPDDIAIIGHGDELPFSWFMRVPLTTIRQPAEEIARNAVSMVIDLIENRQPSERVIRLQGELIVRASSGASLK